VVPNPCDLNEKDKPPGNLYDLESMVRSCFRPACDVPYTSLFVQIGAHKNVEDG
jgi:hypothetical protein